MTCFPLCNWDETTSSCYAVATLSHPLLLQLHPHVFVSSYQRSQNRNILIIHAHVILMLYPEAFLDHRKGKKTQKRNIHAFKEDSLEIMMMTNSNLDTHKFCEKIFSYVFFHIRNICCTLATLLLGSTQKDKQVFFTIHLYHMYNQTQGSLFGV